MTIHQRLPWLQRIVLCLGIMGFCSLVVRGQTAPSKAVEEARQKRLKADVEAKKAEIEERRAILRDRQQLELDVLNLEEELLKEESNVEEKRKKKEELERLVGGKGGLEKQDNGKPGKQPPTKPQPPDFVGKVEASAGNSPGPSAAAPAAQTLENAFLDRRVHVLLYGNTTDPKNEKGQNIGDGVMANLRFMNALFEHQLGSRAAITARIQFDSQTIQKDISTLTVGAADAVVVYIATHGAIQPNGEHVMSQSGTNNIEIKRSLVMDGLRKKTVASSQLRVLITDSCAVYTGSAPQWPKTESEPYPSQILFRLLMTTTGEVSVNAATESRPAYYYSFDNEDGGGFFTRALVYTSVYGRIPTNLQGNEADWLGFFSEVSQRAQLSPGQPPACYFRRDGRPVSF